MTIVDDDVASGARLLSVGDVKILETNDGTPERNHDREPFGAERGRQRPTRDPRRNRKGERLLAPVEPSRSHRARVGEDDPDPRQRRTAGSRRVRRSHSSSPTRSVRRPSDRSARYGSRTTTRSALAVSDTSVVEGDTGTSYVGFSITLSTPASQTVAVTYAVNHTTTNAGDIDMKSGDGVDSRRSARRDVPGEDVCRYHAGAERDVLGHALKSRQCDARRREWNRHGDQRRSRKQATHRDRRQLAQRGQRRRAPAPVHGHVLDAVVDGAEGFVRDRAEEAPPAVATTGRSRAPSPFGPADSASVTIKIKGDAVPEPDETFRVTLSNPGGARRYAPSGPARSAPTTETAESRADQAPCW